MLNLEWILGGLYVLLGPIVWALFLFVMVKGRKRMQILERPAPAIPDPPPSVREPFFHVVSIGAVVLIVWFFRKLSGRPDEKWATWGLPLILGGALGNYIDRIARGFVIDFIEAHWKDQAHWPSFNVADAAIVVGVGCLLIDSFVRKEQKQPEHVAQSPS